MSKPKFPIEVKRGHHIMAKIYSTPSNGCASFTVVHYLGKQRHRKSFAKLDLAKDEADRIANKLSTGQLDALALSNTDSLIYVRSVEAVKPTGLPLDVAALLIAEMYKILDGRDPIEAARYFVKHNPVSRPKKLVPDIVTELVEAKRADGMSKVYLKDLSGRLGRFVKKFTGGISMVTSAEIEDFLRGLEGKGKAKNAKGKPLSGRSKNNYRQAIGTLFNYAEGRGYLPRGLGQVESVALAKEDEGDIEIFRPVEFMAVMENAEAALIPFLAIGAFAGLRHAEIQRLDWSEVRFDDGFIEVKASKAKTASRRLVPIQENLKRWLTPHRKEKGKVCGYANMSKQLLWLAELVDGKLKEQDPTAGFVWKHNALRHSFISYRVAQIQNVAQTALEAGNSPRMVFTNYREIVRPADAEKWFGITAEALEAAKAARQTGAASKIVAMPVGAAAA